LARPPTMNDGVVGRFSNPGRTHTPLASRWLKPLSSLLAAAACVAHLYEGAL
jgi:hypothetical protein